MGKIGRVVAVVRWLGFVVLLSQPAKASEWLLDFDLQSFWVSNVFLDASKQSDALLRPALNLGVDFGQATGARATGLSSTPMPSMLISFPIGMSCICFSIPPGARLLKTKRWWSFCSRRFKTKTPTRMSIFSNPVCCWVYSWNRSAGCVLNCIVKPFCAGSITTDPKIPSTPGCEPKCN